MATTPLPPCHAEAPLGFRNGQVEALKWVALASMFLDHFGRHLLGFGQDTWVFALGRIAFPLFAIVLGLNLARQGDRAGRAARTAMRLAGWCVVAVLPSIWARGDPMVVNVLGTLALGAALCWAIDSPAPVAVRVLACIAIAAAAWFVEFGVAGAFLVPAVYLACVRHEAGSVILVGVLLLATGWLNGQFGGLPAWLGTLAAIPIALAIRTMPLSVPRWQHLFYVGYPLHLALIGALKAYG